jgi:two-component system, cell cycle sensor histidine kinase and response regulator CckA
LKDRNTILVVDDEVESLALLTGFLAAEGYRVRSANSGQLALASVAAWLPSLILLDIHMPDLDGFSVCRQLKASETTRGIPLIFISAATDVEERVAGLALGAVDYITKPFRREELLARVQTHVELYRLRTRLEEQVSQRTMELRATIEQLRESEERFRSMADSAPVMIWVAGADKLCTFFNQGWLTFTGRTLGQCLGHGWSAAVHPEDRERCLANYSSAFDARRRYQTECRLRGADGVYRWVLARGIPRFEPNGVFVGYVGSCVDITDLKHAHEYDLTKQKLETVGALAGGIAHDFNNLLGGVLASTELALAELADGSDPAEELHRIQEASIRGGEIVRQLMVYSGEETEVLEAVDVSEIVKDMLELLKVSVSKRVRVETDLGTGLRAVRANPSQIRQVVMNLFYNASEAIGDRDGVIRVTTAPVTLGPGSSLVNFDRMAEGEYVRLEVSDTGRGMTLDVQARVFDPFFTTKTTGTHGLGLTTVSGIVRSLDGTIRLSSEPGRGTVFQVLLPSGEFAAAAPGSLPVPERPLASRKLILFVDDEDLLRRAVSELLHRKGLSVLQAGDGSSALELIRTRKDDIDMLLLDTTLPGAHSREVYEEARRLRPDLPVIITSAKSKGVAEASLATEVEHFIRKPFSISLLTEKVWKILDSLRSKT